MVTVQLQGGLGNQIIQVMTAYVLAKENNDKLVLSSDGWSALTGKHPSEYRTTIFKNFEWTDEKIDLPLYKETATYQKIYYNKENGVKLLGYFQDVRYFDKYRDELSDLFLNKYPSLHGVCSLHVRRGDYLRLKNKYHVIDADYIHWALKLVDRDKKIDTILLFSDDKNWCDENIKDDRVCWSDFDDVININIMARCEVNVIANSTYSWCGAYLNTSPNKIVISPKEWYGEGKESRLLTNEICI